MYSAGRHDAIERSFCYQDGAGTTEGAMRWLVMPVLLLATGLVACGGDGDERAETINPTAAVTSGVAPPPAPAQAVQNPAASTLVPDLTKAVLALDDMPTGWSVRANVEPPGESTVCDKRLPRFRDQAVDYQRSD